MSRYEFIDAEKANFDVVAMCNALSVSRAAYYDWRSRAPSSREVRREELA